MNHLAHDLMHRCILRGDPLERGVEVQALAEIIRALTARLLVDEVAFRRCPRSSQKVLNRREEKLRQSLERISLQRPRFDQPFQYTHFLRSHTHPLAERWIESTDRVAKRE